MNEKILIVDDEPDMRELLAVCLKNYGFDTLDAATGEEALRRAVADGPHLVLLDLMLPGMDGLEVFRALKREKRTENLPVIMLTAKATETDRIVGLQLGADDYVTKPFTPREVVLRVKKRLERLRTPINVPQVIAMGALLIDKDAYRVTVRKKPVMLTGTEFKLLVALASRHERVQSREALLRDAWDYNNPDIDTRTVDTHVRRLREKLGPAGGYIQTIRGTGYVFRERKGDPSFA